MPTFVMHPTPIAQWLALIHEAEVSSHIRLEQDLESYLAYMLIRFMDNPECVSHALGLEFLLAAQASGSQQAQKLRDVGDQCLLISGLFPGRAERRKIQLSYFIQLGQTAYLNLSVAQEKAESSQLATLYHELSSAFVHLRDVLFAIRSLSQNNHDMEFWQALDLWEENQSALAKKTLDKCHPHLVTTPYDKGSKSN